MLMTTEIPFFNRPSTLTPTLGDFLNKKGNRNFFSFFFLSLTDSQPSQYWSRALTVAPPDRRFGEGDG